MKTTKYIPLMLMLLVIALISISCAGSDKKENLDIKDIVKSINGEPVVPRRANTIYIRDFVNTTPQADIVSTLTSRIEEHISKDRRLAVNNIAESSDLILSGRLTGVTIQNLKFNTMGIAEKKRIRITASVQLIERASMRLIFHEHEMQAFKEFSDIVPPIQTESMALEDVINELARRITAKTITGWYTELMTPVEKGKK